MQLSVLGPATLRAHLAFIFDQPDSFSRMHTVRKNAAALEAIEQ